MGVSPQIHLATGELRSVVTGYSLRQPARVLQPIHCRHHVIGAKAEADFDAKTLPRKQINDRQRSDLAPIRQLVVHKIHAPDLIRTTCRLLHGSMYCGDMPPWPLEAQTQVFLAVDPIESIHANSPTLAAQ